MSFATMTNKIRTAMTIRHTDLRSFVIMLSLNTLLHHTGRATRTFPADTAHATVGSRDRFPPAAECGTGNVRLWPLAWDVPNCLGQVAQWVPCVHLWIFIDKKIYVHPWALFPQKSTPSLGQKPSSCTVLITLGHSGAFRANLCWHQQEPETSMRVFARHSVCDRVQLRFCRVSS